ncbi:MAG: hypothetical protein OHK0047_41960 [Leptolyngbyaceae cyanobacterium]
MAQKANDIIHAGSDKTSISRFTKRFWFMITAGLSGIIVYCFQFNLTTALSVLGVALITAGAALVIGIVLGFLFGIPRTLPLDKSQIMPDQDGRISAESSSWLLKYLPNNNLEQISDWLTKILVGVGLIQINEIGYGFQSLARDTLAPGLGAKSSSASFALVIMIYFLGLGFLAGFIWTSLELATAMREAGEVLIQRIQRLEEREQKFLDVYRNMDPRDKNDSEALVLMTRQLDEASAALNQSDLNQVIENASEQTRELIAVRAENVRTKNWRNSSTKSLMERTIPIFRALTKANPEQFYNHGSLGFALKDKASPTEADLDEAITELTEAIRIRGSWRDTPWKTYYELCRAMCLILKYKNSPEISPEQSDNIIEDLTIAAQTKILNPNLLNDSINQDLRIWMDKHNITIETLRQKHLL